MNEDGSNNQPTNQPTRRNLKAEPENPKGPYRGQAGLSFQNVSTKIPNTPAWKIVLDGVATLAAQERASDSYIHRAALIEYVDRHLPGNWQLPIDNFTENPLPLSEAAQEKLTTVPEKEAAPTIQPLTKDDLRVWGEATLRRFLESPSLPQEERELIEHEIRVRERVRGNPE